MSRHVFAHRKYVSRWIDAERCPDCVYLSHVSPTDGMWSCCIGVRRVLILSSYVPVHSAYVTLSARCIIVYSSHLFVFSLTDCMSPRKIHTECSAYDVSFLFSLRGYRLLLHWYRKMCWLCLPALSLEIPSKTGADYPKEGMWFSSATLRIQERCSDGVSYFRLSQYVPPSDDAA